MTTDAMLSIDDAVSLMGRAPATPAVADWRNSDEPPVELPPEKKDDKPAAGDAPQTDTPAANDAPADDKPADAGDKTPAQDDAPATKDGEDEQGSLPPIEPPSGWKAEEKEVFKSLPRAAQEAIARREQDRTTELRNLQNATADQRKAADAEVVRLKGLADKVSEHVKDQLNDMARDFPDIKTPADVEALAVNDPQRFALFQARLMRFNAAQQAQAEAQAELQRKANEQVREQTKAAHTELVKHFPTWSDPKVATKEITELQDYAISLGANEQAARALHDPMVYRLAHKAMLYDRAQAAARDAINRDPPRVVKPGTSSANPRADRAAANQAAQMRKLTQTGDIEDALALMLTK